MLKVECGARVFGPSRVLIVLALVLGGCTGSHGDSLKQAQDQLAAGHVDAALVLLKQHLADDANSAEGRFLLGQALLRNRDPRAAEVELRKARELGLPVVRLAPVLADALLGQGQPGKLLTEFESVKLDDVTAQAELQAAVAEAYLAKDQRDLAKVAAEKALAAGTGSVRASLVLVRLSALTGDVPAALARLDTMLAKSGANADVWLAKGDVLQYGAKDREAAIKAYSKAVELRPDQVAALVALVRINLERSDVAAAKESLNKLKAVAPNFLQTRFFDAQLAYLAGDLARARSVLQGLLQMVPDDVQLLTFSGAVALGAKELVLGETHLGRAVQMTPSAALPRKLLAQTRLLMGRTGAAISDLQPLLTVDQPDSTVLSLAAQAHLQQGDFKQADALYQRALAVNPHDVGLRTAVAVAQLSRGREADGIAELQAITRDDPGDTAALALISAHMRRGDVAAALQQVDLLIAKTPKNAAHLNLRGHILLAQGKTDAAKSSFEQASAVDPSFFPAVQSLALMDARARNMPGVTSRLEAFVKQFPRHSDARMALAEAMIQQKRPKDEVAKLLDDIIRTDGTYVPARVKLIQLHLAANAPKQAVSVAQAAVLANADRPELLSLLAQAQLAAGEPQQSQTTLNKAVAIAPQQLDLLMQLADVQIATNNLGGATGTLRRALDLAPDSPEIRRRLMALAIANKEPDKAASFARDLQRRRPTAASGYLLEAELAVDRKDWAAAAVALRKGLAANAEPSAQIAAKLFVALQQSGRPAEAEALATDRLRREPVDVQFALRLGELLMLRGDMAGAERFFGKAVTVRPEDASVQNNMAWVLMKQGRPGALAHAAKAVELSKSAAPMLDTYALVLAAEGQLPKAIEVSNQAVGKSPDNPSLRLTLTRLLVQAKKWDLAKEQIDKLRTVKAPFEGAKDLPGLVTAVERKG